MCVPASSRHEDGRIAEIQLDLGGTQTDPRGPPQSVGKKTSKLRSFFQLTKKGSSPVRWSIIFIIFVALFGSSFVITFLFPFLPHMVVTLGYSEEDKGYYAGLVASSFFFGRVFGSYFWGWLSDRKGRKPVILINLALTGITTFGFGFTKTLWFAIILRFITGAMNGVISTAKSVLYEISDDTTQAITMSSISLAWGMGIILGPTVGGLLANPSDRYPDVFPQEGFFKEYPFFLPCMAACLISFFAFLIVLLKLPETHTKILRQRREKAKRSEEAVSRGEEVRRLLEVGKQQGTESIKFIKEQLKSVISLPGDMAKTLHLKTSESCGKFSDHVMMKRPRTYSCSAKVETNSNDGLRKRRSCEEVVNGTLVRSQSAPVMRMDSTAAAVAGQGNGGQCRQTTSSLCWPWSTESGSLLKLLRMPDVQKSVGIYTLLSFAVVGYDQIFAIWSSTDPMYDGLGFTPVQIGLAIGGVSVPLLMLQLFIFPKLESKLGAKRTNHWCCFILMILITATPVMSVLVDKPVPLWITLLVILAPNRIATICCFTSMALFINNSVPPEHAGAVNGLSVTFAAIARAVAPLASGSIFAWSIVQDYGYPIDVNLMFIIFGLVYMAAVIFNLFIPQRLNKQRKKGKRQQPQDDMSPEEQGAQRNEDYSSSSPCAVEKHDGLRGIEIVFEEECPSECEETHQKRHG